jgi:hypothetical protein
MTMLGVEKVAASGPRVVTGIIWIFVVAAVGAILLLAGLWPLALLVYAAGLAAFFVQVDRGWKRRHAEAAATGIEADYTAWEARMLRRVGLLAVAALMLMVVGLLVLAPFMH